MHSKSFWSSAEGVGGGRRRKKQAKLTLVAGSFSFSVTHAWRFKLRDLQVMRILFAGFSSNGLIDELVPGNSFF